MCGVVIDSKKQRSLKHERYSSAVELWCVRVVDWAAKMIAIAAKQVQCVYILDIAVYFMNLLLTWTKLLLRDKIFRLVGVHKTNFLFSTASIYQLEGFY